MSFLAFFHWLAQTRIGLLMRDSTWGFAIVEIGHLLAIAIFGGAILLVDLRMMGFGFKTQPVSRVARELLPLTAGGVIVLAISGALLLASGPMRYYYNPAFRIKMLLFFIALIFHFVLQVRAARTTGERDKSSPLRKVAAILSLALWLSIGLAGRAIGYV